ncbi:MAG: hypothetical protein ACUVT6_12455 [Thermodesulfobacteriota bacterium]
MTEVVRIRAGSGPDNIGISTPPDTNLEGKLISYAPSGWGVMYVKGGQFLGIWVVVEDRSVRIAMPDGTSENNRISPPGIFSWDGGRLMQARKIRDATVSIQISKKDSAALWDNPIPYFFG